MAVQNKVAYCTRQMQAVKSGPMCEDKANNNNNKHFRVAYNIIFFTVIESVWATARDHIHKKKQNCPAISESKH